MSEMRLAVIGLGFMGSTHIKALQSIPEVELAAVCSTDDRALDGDFSRIQGNFGGPGQHFDFSNVAKYREIEALLDDPSIDAVDICLPTDMHASAANEALQSGKHVLVEKPLALDAKTAASMLETAQQHGRILMAGQVLRFMPVYEVLRERISSGSMGPVRWAMFRRRCAAPAWSQWLSNPDRSGGGVFDLLIHDVDMCLHLFGKPETVSATGYEALDAGIDLITAELHYPGKGTAFVTGGWHHPKSYPFSMEYTVVTDGGSFEFSSIGRPPVLYHLDGREEVLPLEEKDSYAAEIAYFAECCRRGKQPELCPPEESAAAVAVMRLLLEARNRNGEVIECRI
ncbi:MAG: Gfo/Idh/MocA family oxidoreductase [Acidobacteriaceae bacterium]|nr:Gfo/Idh/MocA family oxidoreductase [Acidobacteriaceae bacterium]